MVRGRSLLIAAVTAMFVLGAASEAVDRLWSFHLIEGIGLPGDASDVARFRAFGVAELVGGIVLAGVIGRTTNFESGRALAVTLSALTAVVTAGWLLGLANALWLTVAAYWLAQRSRATSAPSSPPG